MRESKIPGLTLFLFLFFGFGILTSLYSLVFAGEIGVPRVLIGGREIEVEVADSPEEWITGLSGRPRLPDGTGMLFVYPDRVVRTFWMKDMQFPLDIIWIDGQVVVKVDRNAPPEGSRPSRSYSSHWPVDVVLEVPGGSAGRWGIKPGDRLSLP